MYQEICWCCGGHGTLITCWDDICHGLGYCIHGRLKNENYRS